MRMVEELNSCKKRSEQPLQQAYRVIHCRFIPSGAYDFSVFCLLFIVTFLYNNQGLFNVFCKIVRNNAPSVVKDSSHLLRFLLDSLCYRVVGVVI